MAKLSNRFFKCFRPNSPIKPKGPKMSAPLSGPDSCNHASSDGKQGEHRRTPRGLRWFTRNVLFDASLVKMIRIKKSQNKYHTSKNNTLLAKINEASLSSDVSPMKDLKADSDCNSAHHSPLNSPFSTPSSTPYCSPNVSSGILTTSQGPNQYVEHKQSKQLPYRKMLVGRNRGLNFMLCLLIVGLLICWGKVCAIFCTATLLVLVPRQIKCVKSLGHAQVGSQEVGLKEHKKRAIMG